MSLYTKVVTALLTSASLISIVNSSNTFTPIQTKAAETQSKQEEITATRASSLPTAKTPKDGELVYGNNISKSNFKTLALNDYSYCSSPNSDGYITDISRSVKITSDPNIMNFYVIANGNIGPNGFCPASYVKTNYISVFPNHVTYFDLDTNGAPSNVVIGNSNANSYTMACEGTKTVLNITDPDWDKLTFSQVVNGDDFNVNTEYVNSILKISFDAKNASLNAYNIADIYVAEEILSGIAGQFRTDADGKSIAISTSTVVENVTAKMIKLVQVPLKSPNCDSSLYTTNSSSSSSNSSSIIPNPANGKAVLNNVNNYYSFCSSMGNNYIASYVTDINGSIKKTTDDSIRNFYVIKNTDKVGDSCPSVSIKSNYLSVFPYHTTSFDLDTNGSPINVKIANTNPSTYTVSCSGNDTIVTVADTERDTLLLKQVANNSNFKITSITGSSNELKVAFSPKSLTLTTSDIVDIDIEESSLSGLAGQFRQDPKDTTIMVAIKTSDVIEDVVAKVVKFSGVKIYSKCCVPSSEKGGCDITPRSSSTNNIYWRNNKGDTILWGMENTTKKSYKYIGNFDSSWYIAGSSDFDGDYTKDIVWRNKTTGQNLVWLMNTDNTLKLMRDLPAVGIEWSLVGVANMTNEGQPNLIWRNKNGQNVIWGMKNYSVTSSVFLNNTGTEWDIVAVSDMNTDNSPDIIWRNKNGQNVIWYMNNYEIKSSIYFESVGSEWKAVVR
jgi:hypothetical protein